MEDVKRILVLSRSTKDCKKAVHYGFLLREHTGLNSRYSTSCMIRSSSDVWFLPNLPGMEEEYRAMMEEVKSDLVE